MQAVPASATSQTKLSDNLSAQPALLVVAATTAEDRQAVVLQNRSAPSDPRGAAAEASVDVIDPADSTAPALKLTGTRRSETAPHQAALSFHQLVEAGNLDEVEIHLLHEPAFRDAIDEQTGLTPLCMAAMNGHIEIVAFLLEMGAPVDACELYGSTALMFAAQTGDVEMIRLLLAADANPNAVNVLKSKSVLAWAINVNNLHACQVLIEAGADLHFTMKKTVGKSQAASPLDAAIVLGCTDLLQWLLETRRFRLESEIIPHTTPLNFACYAGNLTSVNFFLDAGASVSVTVDESSRTVKGPFWFADLNGHFHVVEYLLNQGLTIPLHSPLLTFPDWGFLHPQTQDLVNHADLLIRNRSPHSSGLKDAALMQEPQKLIAGLADKKIELRSNYRGWTHWLSELGVSSVISNEIFKLTSHAATVFRVLAGNHASTSREQYLQALVDIVSDACASPNLNAPFSNVKMTGQGELVMNRMVHRQRALLLRGVASLREAQLQRLSTLPELFLGSFINGTGQVREAALHRMLTCEWGLYEPVTQAAIRLLKIANAHVRRLPASAGALPLAVQLRHALTSILQSLSREKLVPEFDNALRELGEHVNKSLYAELVFSQWRTFNEAHQVAVSRPLKFGPFRPAVEVASD